MGKITFFLVVCGVFLGYGQDCSIQKILSNDVSICSGQGTLITLFNSEVGVSYQLRDASNNPIGFPVIGTGGDINFSASPTSTTTYNVLAGSCPSAYLDTITVTVFQPSIGGIVTVSPVGVTPVVTVNTICHLGSGWLYLSGHTGNVIRWESSIDGGNNWTVIANTTASYNYTALNDTTIFRAVVQNGTCAISYSSTSVVVVIPNIKPTVVAMPATICEGESSTLTALSGYATSQGVATGGAFSYANPDGWEVDGNSNGLNAGGSNTKPTGFRLTTSNSGTYSGTTYTSTGKFAIAHGAIDSELETPIFNSFGLASFTIQFNHAFNLTAGAKAKVWLSLDGGNTYNILLSSYTGALTRTPYNNFPQEVINLNNYIGQPNLRVKFSYHGLLNSSWAIDNIGIPQTPTGLTTQWLDQNGNVLVSTNSVSSGMTVTPPVTTTYYVVSYINGCTSYGPEGTAEIKVTVRPRPTASIGTSQNVCIGDSATLSIALTGTAPWTITYSNGSTNTTVTTSTNPYNFTVYNLLNSVTYTVTALNDKNCTAKPSDLTGSAVLTVLNGTRGLWTGIQSQDWFDCKNWAGGIPTGSDDAVIPNGSVRMPVIDRASIYAPEDKIAICRDLVVANAASLTMINNSLLDIKRDWKNSGTFTPGQGTVTFNGEGTNQVQLINSGIKLNETFYNLTLNSLDSAIGVNLPNNFQLTVANLLTLTSGILRLTDEAQLLQLGDLANPIDGSGKLLRDQQGKKSSFHYNYWSSPVSLDGVNYTISGILRDGTDAVTNPYNPGLISFGNAFDYADGAISTPIKISNRWIHKYTLSSTNYNSWQRIGSTSNVKIGEGYTMKGVTGTAAISDIQNYVYAGKPNNGTIGLTIGLNQSYLIGNPYASALDANEFILDNMRDGGGRASSNRFNGALYFYDNFGGNSHNLANYVAGYATYTLMGGVVAISNDPMINNNGSSGVKVPQRYIPVGQAFFVNSVVDPALVANNPNLATAITGGSITFKNSQRVFKTEGSGESIFFRTTNNISNQLSEDARPKIRLQYDSPSNMHRQILIGADENATLEYDFGFDAVMADVNPDDMYWTLNGAKLVIQAVPQFNANQIIPLTLKITNQGNNVVRIASVENLASDQEIYLFDELTGVYHNLRSSEFSIILPAGEYSNRFSIRFSNPTLSVSDNNLNQSITVFYSDDFVNIKNQLPNVRVENAQVFSILGQNVLEYKLSNEDQTNIQLPVSVLSAGPYIVKVKTDNGVFSKKIIIE
ncbi:T9SS type A sorting domain-containing protein [Flavobacterium terrae]|uniref:Por secretion system C-terminal sorting domain-containing protein n=1 Tax=Flavobacterium terrae TaxID=415425 RepID=A0A1M6B215_9FLAO|nr:T9SS type A sorting domain-containing protein [Flavobacterium terrae]SHI42771.1 Por secretion system C-terminal sorting domain-containing protein [Flavobacterium terrae]